MATVLFIYLHPCVYGVQELTKLMCVKCMVAQGQSSHLLFRRIRDRIRAGETTLGCFLPNQENLL